MRLLTLLCFCVFSMILSGQNIITDRPDQTESAYTVNKNQFQIETGSGIESVSDVNIWTLNSTLIRYGLTEKLELRLVSGLSMIKRQFSDQKGFGISDLELGLKYQIIDGPIAFAVLGHVITPNATSGFGSEYTRGDLRLAFSHDVTKRIGFGYNLGFNYSTEEDYALTYSYAIGFGLTDKIGLYVELYGDQVLLKEYLTFNYNHGITYLISPDLQLDFSVGTGLSDKSNFYAIGVSWRTSK